MEKVDMQFLAQVLASAMGIIALGGICYALFKLITR
jgi:hypothetical protein